MGNKIPAVTFKNDTKPSGLARVTHIPGAAIKVKGVVVGRIERPHWHSQDPDHRYRVKLHLKDEGLPAKWVTLAYRGESLDEAKEWVKWVWPALYAKFGELLVYRGEGG